MNSEITTLSIDNVQYAHEFNPRTRGKSQADLEKRLNDPALRQAIAESGLQTPLDAVVWSNGQTPEGYEPNKPYILRGTTRKFLVSQLKKLGITDPTTGKVFDTVPVVIHQNLTLQQCHTLADDHSHRGLTRDEVYVNFETLLNNGMKPADIAAAIRPQLDNVPGFSKPDAERETKINNPDPRIARAEYYEFRKGTLDVWKKIAELPSVARDFAFDNLLKAGNRLMDKKHITELWTAHQTDLKEDVACKVTRSTPGPKFQEAWARFQDEVEKARAVGDQKVKAISAANREDMDRFQKAANSTFVKKLMNALMRTNGYGDAHVIELDNVAVLYSKGKWEDANTKLETILPVA